MIPEGIIPPVLTPLRENREIDLAAFRALLDKLIDGGVDALFIAGTAGLGSILTNTQYETLLFSALKHVNGRKAILAGVLEPSTARCVERLKLLEKLGAAAAVVIAPYYSRAENDIQLMRHFEVLRENTSMELVVYNIPYCTGTNISINLICEMKRREWVTACKDSSGDAEYFAGLCKSGKECGLRVYQGLRPDFSLLGKLGASGCVPVPANPYPGLFAEAWKKRFDKDKIPHLQKECDSVWERLVAPGDFFSRSVKLLSEQGIGTGAMPEPFTR